MNSGDSTIIVHSYAKVNLTLNVLGGRPDGYHAIESVMQSISLHDTLTLRLGNEPCIRISCDMPGIPTDERNLAYKAASLFFDRLGIAPALDIRIEKRIPPEAGLGGGSSNAAAVLRALGSERSASSVQRSALLAMAGQIGSDVPFFLVGGTALVRGRGEEVEPLPDIRPWWLAIVKPPFGVSTAWAYGRLDEMRQAVSELQSGSERMVKCIERQGCQQLPELLSNDLELPSVEQHPEIAEIKNALTKAGAKAALMCGSGSAVFGLFDSEDMASRAADIMDNYGQVFAERTITREEALS